MMVDSRYPIPSEASEIKYSSEIGGHCKEVFNSIYERLHPTVKHINK